MDDPFKEKAVVIGDVSYGVGEAECRQINGSSGVNYANGCRTVGEQVINISDSPAHFPGSISEVPPVLRCIDPNAFEPQVVAIGPYHRDKEAKLAVKEEDKLLFNQHLLGFGDERVDENMRSDRMKQLLSNISPMEGMARDCYSEKFSEMSSEKFVRMMVLDGCFVIAVLFFGQKLEIDPTKFANDLPIITTRWMLPLIRLDLIKFENQIPFFILRRLHTSLLSFGIPLTPVDCLAHTFFSALIGGAQEMPLVVRSEDESRYFEHLLALFHSLINPKYYDSDSHEFVKSLEGETPYGHFMIRASKIWSRGILLKKKRSSSSSNCNYGLFGSFFIIISYIFKKSNSCFISLSKNNSDNKKKNDNFTDVSYHHGVLEVPCFTINHNTSCVLRNMVTYEQTNRRVESRVTSFITFMNALVDTPTDVAFLRHKKIISHNLGSDEEVSSLINNLNKGIPHNNHECFLCQLDKNVKPTFRKFVRIVSSFSEFVVFAVLHPSSFITVFLAVLALYVGITQTVLAVLAILFKA